MWTAILVACLATAPADLPAEALAKVGCRTHEMLILAGANPVSAFIEAQTRAADWLVQHPELAQRSLTIHPGRSA